MLNFEKNLFTSIACICIKHHCDILHGTFLLYQLFPFSEICPICSCGLSQFSQHTTDATGIFSAEQTKKKKNTNTKKKKNTNKDTNTNIHTTDATGIFSYPSTTGLKSYHHNIASSYRNIKILSSCPSKINFILLLLSVCKTVSPTDWAVGGNRIVGYCTSYFVIF